MSEDEEFWFKEFEKQKCDGKSDSQAASLADLATYGMYINNPPPKVSK